MDGEINILIENATKTEPSILVIQNIRLRKRSPDLMLI